MSKQSKNLPDLVMYPILNHNSTPRCALQVLHGPSKSWPEDPGYDELGFEVLSVEECAELDELCELSDFLIHQGV